MCTESQLLIQVVRIIINARRDYGFMPWYVACHFASQTQKVHFNNMFKSVRCEL